MQEVVPPTWGSSKQLLKKHKIHKFRERCVLKLKRVAMANILRIYLILNVACFYSLEMFLCYYYSILSYISIILALGRQLYGKK